MMVRLKMLLKRQTWCRSGWGQGVCVGDFDNDGDEDLMVTYFGQNVLYRNEGNGKFTDITEKAGLLQKNPRWSTGCTFIDYDKDGKLDLFIAEYVVFDIKKIPAKGHEPVLPMEGDSRDVRTARLAWRHEYALPTITGMEPLPMCPKKPVSPKPSGYYGFSPFASDYDNDGWPDIYLSCDSTPNILYHNNGNGTFTDIGLISGGAFPRRIFRCRHPRGIRRTAGTAPPGTPGRRVPVHLSDANAVALTFEFDEQIVGYPGFAIDAPAGTTIELLVQEGHSENGPALLNTHFHSWTRFICRNGENTFEVFDFETVIWLQLHVHGGSGEIRIRNVHVQRRLYPWPHQPRLTTNDPRINKLIAASVNTLLNSAQETAVDGMGRERQQYSGDGSHQLHGIYFAFGDTRLPARFITTFSQGCTLDGYFFDCWPAYDRLARVMERQLGMTQWGPILDHSVGFVFDCYYYLFYTGDLGPLREAYPRLQRFIRYLRDARIRPQASFRSPTSASRASGWTTMPTDAGYPHHKQCAFNLYVSAMLTHAFPVVAEALDDKEWAKATTRLGRELLRATQKTFWDPNQSLFVVNRPWLAEEGEQRLCDRSLATALLFNQCPGCVFDRCLDALATLPANMGLSYPANAGWRLWALAKGRRIDVVLREFRERWWPMESVQKNNTLQESWKALPDSGDLWSHCPVAPLYVMAMGVAGIQPLSPGWRKTLIHPQPGDLTSLALTTETPQGPLSITTEGSLGDRRLSLLLPEGCEAELVLDRRRKDHGSPAPPSGIPGTQAFRLAGGPSHEFHLLYT